MPSSSATACCHSSIPCSTLPMPTAPLWPDLSSLSRSSLHYYTTSPCFYLAILQNFYSSFILQYMNTCISASFTCTFYDFLYYSAAPFPYVSWSHSHTTCLFTLKIFSSCYEVLLLDRLLWSHSHACLHARFPEDKKARNVDLQFMWGGALLITPVLQEGARSVRGYFPPSARWFELRNVSQCNTVCKNFSHINHARPSELSVSFYKM